MNSHAWSATFFLKCWPYNAFHGFSPEFTTVAPLCLNVPGKGVATVRLCNAKSFIEHPALPHPPPLPHPPVRVIMVSHKEFTNAGKQPGLQVWRIENLDLKPVPKALHGNFYSGDAYLLLFATAAPAYNLHMWLGKNRDAPQHRTPDRANAQ